MGSILQVSSDGSGNKGLAKLNRCMEDDHKEVRDDSMGLSEEDESRINEAAENMNSVTGGATTSLAHQTSLQKHQHPIVRWERFLPVRRLKVLLVENDDSTRQVVSALLSNCSYEVAAAANGLQAWKIIEDLTNHIDLVLTEVIMPCFSGIGLLYKIMNHKACKNIPVIMMSSNDSMGIVFKCLSKGAVDFLVKPIRKNELKNIWQHVWRRCHSSSGSGSGIQIQQSAKSKSTDDSDNNTGSNDEDVSGSIGLNARDGSDNRSETQNSWTKRAVEVNSPQPQFPSDQLADPHDNTSVHAIHPKIETFCNEWVPMTANGEIREQEETADNIMGKKLETGPHLTEVSIKGTSGSVDKSPENHTQDEGLLRLEISNAPDEPIMEAADLIGVIANATDAQPITQDTESPNECSKPSEGKDQAFDSSMDLPSLNLSLKRPRSTGEGGTAMHSDRTVLRHSNLSAFSRYDTTAAAATQAPACYVGSRSPLDNSSEAVKTEPTINVVSNGSSDNNDMGSTTKNAISKPTAFKGKPVAALQVERVHLSAFHPVPLRTSAIPQVMQERRATDAIGEQLMGIQHQVQVQHSHHYYHHHHLLVHSMQQLPDHDEQSFTTKAADAPRCRSSDVFARPMEGNAANHSVHGSNSGSNQGSYGQNGSSAAVNAGGINVESSNGVTGRSGTEGGNGSGGGVDQNRFARREAALNKFRQKRKERNFEKTVRYQSRKRLAEQRPRVRGQFVRRGIHDGTSRDADT